MKILSITTNVSRFGGAQKVMLDVHNGIKKHYPSKIIGFQKFENVHPKYGIKEEEYIELKNPWQLNNHTVIVHARNVIPLLVLAKKVFFLNTKIIYVSHNVYDTYSAFTLFPKTIVSISQKVTENLVHYFKQNPKNIHLIYNGILDTEKEFQPTKKKNNQSIKILYVARVNPVKRQLQIVEHLKNTLDKSIEIHFAGVGEDYETLKTKCENLPNFKALGFVENMIELIKAYDYLMLYSVQEGLPIALIEGAMCGKPLLVNDVGGNLEIGEPEKNGIELKNDWQKLAEQLNKLIHISKEEYVSMSIKSREIYLKKFQYDQMINGYVGLIES
jgi:glycosyltransferase involved in cell wall biosynthesis